MNGENLRQLESRIGYAFGNKGLAITALTHPSYGGDHHVAHYQRLEFLGDAVLELSVSRMLFDRSPALSEGQLTRLRASLVREESLADIARDWGIGSLIRLSVGEEKSGGASKPSILSDVIEALLAAVYLDGGIDAAFAFVERMLKDSLRAIKSPDALDAKSRLQEVLQQRGEPSPEYELLSQEGPMHLPVFRVCVRLGGQIIGEGEGTSKRAAQQEAAAQALKRLS